MIKEIHRSTVRKDFDSTSHTWKNNPNVGCDHGRGVIRVFDTGVTESYRHTGQTSELGDHHVFKSIVRNTVKLGEAPLTGRPITTYAGSSEAARTYRELAREVIDLG